MNSEYKTYYNTKKSDITLYFEGSIIFKPLNDDVKIIPIIFNFIVKKDYIEEIKFNIKSYKI